MYFSIFILSYENWLQKATKCFQSMIVSWHQKIQKMKWNIQQEKNPYTPRGEDKEKENNLDFLYLSLCCVYPLHWVVNFNWTATYCSWVHTGSIKKSCCYFFSILLMTRSIVGVIMLTPVSWQNASLGNYILPMEISVANSAEYFSLYFPFLIITLHSTAVYR